MFSFRRPADACIRDYLAVRAEAPFSYDQVGCSREEHSLRPGWNIDHERVPLGRGEETFGLAREAIQAWRMFPTQIAELCWPATPRPGQVVGVLYWAAPVGMWILFPARVVYLVSDRVERDGHTIERFGFAYGTLPDHPEQGEERFLVEWDRTEDRVWYDLFVVSRPAHWLARLGYFYARWEQARFRRLSGKAMQETVGGN